MEWRLKLPPSTQPLSRHPSTNASWSKGLISHVVVGLQMAIKSKLTIQQVAYNVQVKSSFHRSVIARPVQVCNLNQGKNNALRPLAPAPPKYCIGVTPQQCVSFFLPMLRTPLWCHSEMTERHGLFSPPFGRLNGPSVWPVCFRLIASRSNKLVMMYAESPVTPAKRNIMSKRGGGGTGDAEKVFFSVVLYRSKILKLHPETLLAPGQAPGFKCLGQSVQKEGHGRPVITISCEAFRTEIGTQDLSHLEGKWGCSDELIGCRVSRRDFVTIGFKWVLLPQAAPPACGRNQ